MWSFFSSHHTRRMDLRINKDFFLWTDWQLKRKKSLGKLISGDKAVSLEFYIAINNINWLSQKVILKSLGQVTRSFWLWLLLIPINYHNKKLWKKRLGQAARSCSSPILDLRPFSTAFWNSSDWKYRSKHHSLLTFYNSGSIICRYWEKMGCGRSLRACIWG